MEPIDSRLFPLFETLSRAGLSWLALEIMEELQTGERLPASPEALEAIRKAISENRDPAFIADSEIPDDLRTTENTRRISGDEQVTWAVKYISSRLDSALAAMQESAVNLENLYATDVGVKVAALGVRRQEFSTLRTSDNVFDLTSAEVDVARKGIEPLQRALKDWAEATIGDQKA